MQIRFLAGARNIFVPTVSAPAITYRPGDDAGQHESDGVRPTISDHLYPKTGQPLFFRPSLNLL
jgi:hypothetical protein